MRRKDCTFAFIIASCRAAIGILGTAIVLIPVPMATANDQIVTVSPSASFCCRRDTTAALSDGKEPENSSDRSIPRFTFWSHRGTSEWVQYDFDQPLCVSSVEIYWFDDRPGGGCRVPESWKLLYASGYDWLPVRGVSDYGVDRDGYNTTTCKPVVTTALRIQVQQQPGYSSGALEWKVNGSVHKLGQLGRVGHDAPAQAGTSYLKARLALAVLAATKGDRQHEAEAALAQLDELAANHHCARAQTDVNDGTTMEQLEQAGVRLAEFVRRHSVDEIVLDLDRRAPDAALRLMTQLDWLDQDGEENTAASFRALLSTVIDRSGFAGTDVDVRRDRLASSGAPVSDGDWMELYLESCERRRQQRLEPHLAKLRKVVFTKHHDLGGQHYAYTEDVSDSPYNDNNPFKPTAELCLLEMDGLYGSVRTLVDEPKGIIRDPDVSYDGRRILFAWRKSMAEDDYHLYEMTVDDGQIRQLTFGQGVADFEPCYLPNGHIVFNSSRCQQIVDCWYADVSNLFTCAPDGRYLRRLSYDQVHTNYPQVLPDGRVTYTRWDYNDRGQLWPQPLFVMNPDGTGQTEFYGNNSWFPTTILHARGIPDTQKVVCVLSGHHTYQKGKLAIIDPALGRQENAGVQLIAPMRDTPAVKVDAYGYQGHQFQYPYPLSQTEFLVTFSTAGSVKPREHATKPFGIYFMQIDGQRELLAADAKVSCSQSLPVAPRPQPRLRRSVVDYRQKTGTYFLADVYHGPGLAGVPRGTIKRLRVVALDFRAAAVGSNRNRGPAGGAVVSTPISINGAWDVKKVLGTANVYEDGSAAFTVPARTPVYFQALDENNRAVQTMRSWSTLQPGERFSCVGCHEHKNGSPPSGLAITEAMRQGPQELDPFYGPPRGFSFVREIQPILDKHCVSCHNRKSQAEENGDIILEGTAALDGRSRKYWSDAYKTLADPELASWVSPQSEPTMLPPYHAGAAQSRLVAMLAEGHEDVSLSREDMDKIACWIDLAVPYCGEYTEAMDEKAVPSYQKWLDKRLRWEAEEDENIRALLAAEAER